MSASTATESGSSGPRSGAGRRRELDVLGMAIVLGLVFFHTLSIFSGHQYIVNSSQSEVAGLVSTLIVSFEALWTMPLMMLIAGVAIWYSLQRRSPAEFLRERLKRLLVPLLTGLVLLVPPMSYFWLQFRGEAIGSYLQFYPRFWRIKFALSAFPVLFESPPPEEVFTVSHLWFLVVLFVYTLLLLPLFVYLRSDVGRRLREGMATFFARRWAIFLLALPIALVEAVLTTEWLGVWNRFVWAFLLLYGFVIASDDRLSDALVRHRRGALVFGILFYFVYFAGMGMLMETAQVDPFTDRGAGAGVVRFFKGVASWFCVAGIMGIATFRGRQSSQGTQAEDSDGMERRTSLVGRITAYFQEAQLPFYVLHQTPIIVIGYYVIQWNMNSLLKFLLISLPSLLITLIVYDIAVRRTAVTRFLFGMRSRRRA